MTTAASHRRRWWGRLRWPVGLGVVAWLIVPNWNGLREIVAAGVAWPWLLGAAGMRMTALGLACVRWNLLLVGQQIHLPWHRVLRLQCTGYVCNFLFPGTWGGDVARAGLIAADTPDRRMRGAASVPLDRGLGLLAFVLVGAIAGLANWSQIPPGLLRLAVIALVALAALGTALLSAMLLFPVSRRKTESATGETTKPDVETEPGTRQPVDAPEATPARRRRLAHELLVGLSLLRASRGSVVVAFLLAILGHSCLCASLYCCLRAYPAAKVPATAADHFWIVPAAEVPAALLPVPGGVGAREGTLALLYGSLTADSVLSDRYSEVGVIVAATFSTVCLMLALVVGLGLALSGLWPARNPAPEPSCSTEKEASPTN